MTDMIFNSMIGCIETCTAVFADIQDARKAKRASIHALRVPCVFWTCC